RWRLDPALVKPCFHSYMAYDREGAWTRAAVRAATRSLQVRTYQAVVTSGPPHMVHRGGELLARRYGVPFVMDMRDPWSLVERLPAGVASPLWLQLARHHEGRCVEAAALI